MAGGRKGKRVGRVRVTVSYGLRLNNFVAVDTEFTFPVKFCF